jgi:hypothetical protein
MKCNNCNSYQLFKHSSQYNHTYIDTNVYQLYINKTKDKCNYDLIFKSYVYNFNDHILIHKCCFELMLMKTKTISILFNYFNSHYYSLNKEIFNLNNDIKITFSSTTNIIELTSPINNAKHKISNHIKIMQNKYKKALKLYKSQNFILNELIEIQKKRIRELTCENEELSKENKKLKC